MTLPYTGERVVPWSPAVGWQVMSCHVARYSWATARVWGKRIVDLGCGSGYGAYLLSWSCKSVLGIDINLDAIAYASTQFDSPNLSFSCTDLSTGVPPVAEIYVAFEFLEHLDRPAKLLAKLDAPLVWSIPIESVNAYHRSVLSQPQIYELMDGSEFYFQSDTGDIAPAGFEWFSPAYVLGVLPA